MTTRKKRKQPARQPSKPNQFPKLSPWSIATISVVTTIVVLAATACCCALLMWGAHVSKFNEIQFKMFEQFEIRCTQHPKKNESG